MDHSIRPRQPSDPLPTHMKPRLVVRQTDSVSKRPRYRGWCNVCGSQRTERKPGVTCCIWGRCNGTVNAVNPVREGT